MAGKTGKKTSRKKGNTKSRTKAAKINQSDFKNEVILWIVLAVSIILFVSNLGFGGVVGNKISSVLFGIFGIIAYIFPLFLFFLTAFFLSNKRNKIAWIKIIAGILLILCLCLFFQLLSDKYNSYTPMQAFENSRNSKNAGGFMGGVLETLLYPNFGLISTYVIDIVLTLISVVLLTEKSIFSGVKKGSSFLYRSARTDAQKRKVRNEQRREQRAYEREQEEAQAEQRRMDKKAFGVAIDTKIKNNNSSLPSDDMDEFIPDFPINESTATPDNKVNSTILNTSTHSDTIDINKIKIEEPVFEDDFSNNREISSDLPTLNPQLVWNDNSNDDDDLPPLDIHGIFDDADLVPETPYSDERTCVDSKHDLFEDKKKAVHNDSDYLSPKNEGLDRTSRLDNSEDTNGIHDSQKHAQKRTKEQINENVNAISNEISEKPITKEYIFPSISLLSPADKNAAGDTKAYLQETAMKLQQTLKNFGVNVTVTNVSCGPAVTRYEIQPEMGVKVSKIVNLADDIKLNLAAADIRIEAPIPGKAAVGIEVPNRKSVPVMFRELIESNDFQTSASALTFAAGKDIAGNVVITDIAKMPHLLIAGATGSGKSVCINTIIMSILYKSHPDNVKLIMIDPKVVELSVYNGIPHLLIPVVTDPKKAAGALHWAVTEMTERYQKFAQYNVRDMNGYNKKIESIQDIEEENKPTALPHIIIIVDELADLMMVAPGDVEDAICRLAQLARAAGIHLVIATQRPSVNVITGLIKANMPSRIAFSVTSGVDSRTILDMNGAEKLLGKGDMLFYPQGLPKPKRVQGAFVSDKEVFDVVSFLTEKNGIGTYDSSLEEKMNTTQDSNVSITDSDINSNERDNYFLEAAQLMVDKEKGSIGMMQRYLKVGFNRAARIMDQLEEAGIVGPEEGTKPRRVLMTQEQLDVFIEENL